MGTTEPIRDKDDLKKFLNYYKNDHPSPRNYAMTVLGLHTALRISDILNLKWENVYNFQKNCFLEHICLNEKKTGKQSIIAVNAHVKEALESYRSVRDPKPEHYIFSKRTNTNMPLCRTQAYRIVKKAAEETLLSNTHISCHSLRKTFGYHAWKQGISPVMLMDIYNHSSFDITKRYLGIGQDERDSIFLKIDF